MMKDSSIEFKIIMPYEACKGMEIVVGKMEGAGIDLKPSLLIVLEGFLKNFSVLPCRHASSCKRGTITIRYEGED